MKRVVTSWEWKDSDFDNLDDAFTFAEGLEPHNTLSIIQYGLAKGTGYGYHPISSIITPERVRENRRAIRKESSRIFRSDARQKTVFRVRWRQAHGVYTFRFYVLFHPMLESDVRYVGITTKSLKERLNGHIQDARAGKSKNLDKDEWIVSILQEGLIPGIRQIDELRCMEKEAREKEEYWVWYYLRRRHELLNQEYVGGSARYLTLVKGVPDDLTNDSVFEYSRRACELLNLYYYRWRYNDPPKKVIKAELDEIVKSGILSSEFCKRIEVLLINGKVYYYNLLRDGIPDWERHSVIKKAKEYYKEMI